MLMDLSDYKEEKDEDLYALTPLVSKEFFLRWLYALGAEMGVHTFPLEVRMPCGKFIVYKSEKQFPEKSDMCPCGSDKHWIVKYMLN